MGAIFNALLAFAVLQVCRCVPQRCCPITDVMNGTRCEGGTQTIFNCSKVIWFGNYSVLEDDYLVIDTNVVEREKYCLTKLWENVNDSWPVFCREVAEEDSSTATASLMTIAVLVSVVFLLLTIGVYALVPQLRDLQGECILNSISGLAFAFLFLACINSYNGYTTRVCLTLVFLIYSSFLYCFFWLNVVSIQTWRSIVKQDFSNDRKWRLGYYLYAIGGCWFCTLVLIVIQFSPQHDFHPRLAESRCWFNDIKTTYIYFYTPISILLCTNIVLFIWTTVALNKKKFEDQRNAKTYRYKFWLYVKLFFIMGLSWIFEVVSGADIYRSLAVFWTITDFINALQGVLIFILLVVTRKRALRGLASRTYFGRSLMPTKWKKLEDDEESIELENEIHENNGFVSVN